MVLDFEGFVRGSRIGILHRDAGRGRGRMARTSTAPANPLHSCWVTLRYLSRDSAENAGRARLGGPAQGIAKTKAAEATRQAKLGPRGRFKG